ncbi:MAG TPA: glycerol kinase GlpK [Sunxiuqinia sp.]|nr:glycerol kinase GlpK [Sunxiuqinia sp.]
MNSPQQYILAIDQSTSATKAILFNKQGKVVHRVTVAHQQFYPQPGFVEHDPVEIFENTKAVMQKVLQEKAIDVDEIASIALTNQRETVMVWDKNTGEPAYNAMVWQCQRGAPYCHELKEKGYDELIKSKTGLLIDPYFSASRLHWVMQNVEGLKQRAAAGELLLGTMDTWVLWKLTGGKVHATDYSNACRTMLFNIHSLKWDDELISLFGLERNMFPDIRFSDEVFGHSDPDVIFGRALPIAGLLGDSHGALFGQNCFSAGMAKSTYGTGSSIMMNIGTKPLDAPQGLVTSIGYSMNKQIHYVFEGNVHCTGDTLNWLKNEVQLINDASETEPLAKSVDDNNGVYLVPAFVGLGAPYWDNEARACLSGMPRNTTKAHIVRAALESIAYQVKDLIKLMEEKGNIELQELRVDGGPTRNNFLMQFQSDMLAHEVARSDIEEVSALGATFMAGLATGFWKDLEEVESLREVERVFNPIMEKEETEELYKGWQKAVERARLS